MKHKTKVLVVGGGPAGSTAASVLARQGIEVLLLEKKTLFSKPCGGGISSVACKEFYIPERQMQKKVDTVRLISPRGNTVCIDLNPEQLCIVDRLQFDGYLRERAAQAGAEVLEGTFQGVTSRKKFYRTSLTDGEGRKEIESEYIIAADGVNSKVRNSLGIGAQPALLTISEKIGGLQSDACEFWFSSQHAHSFYSWVFPSANGISAGTGSGFPGRIKHLFETFKRRMQLHNHEGEMNMHRIPVWKGDLYNRGNILFAGDSAGQVMPLSFEGIYYSMKSAELAAEAVIKGDAGLYRKTWKGLLYKRFLFMSKLSSYFLKNDVHTEKLVSLHSKPEVQEAAKALWLFKDQETGNLRKYLRFVGKLFI